MDSCVLAHCFNCICCPLLELQPLDPRLILGDSRWKGETGQIPENSLNFPQSLLRLSFLISGRDVLSAPYMTIENQPNVTKFADKGCVN